MTETKFTTWRRADSGYYFNIIVDKGVTVQLEKSLNRDQLLKNKATADLIYAAPELYDVLSAMCEYHRAVTANEDVSWYTDLVPIYEKAINVLKKARGEKH